MTRHDLRLRRVIRKQIQANVDDEHYWGMPWSSMQNWLTKWSLCSLVAVGHWKKGALTILSTVSLLKKANVMRRRNHRVGRIRSLCNVANHGQKMLRSMTTRPLIGREREHDSLWASARGSPGYIHVCKMQSLYQYSSPSHPCACWSSTNISSHSSQIIVKRFRGQKLRA